MHPCYRLAIVFGTCLSFTLPAAAFFVPTGGPLLRNAVDVATSPNGDLFALNNDQVVSRFDFGTTRWTMLPSPPATVSKLEIAADGQIWTFGSGETFFSDNEGLTWDHPGAVPAIQQVAFDAAGRVFAATAAGLYRSQDRGASWVLLGLSPSAIEAIDIAPDGSIWVAVAGGLHHSTNAGDTWNLVAALPLPASALAAHPDGGVYAGLANRDWPTCEAGGLYRVDANGSSSLLGFVAQPVADILVRSDGSATISVGSGCLYYQACGNCGYPGGPDCGQHGIYRSFDGGATWAPAETGSAVAVPRELVLRQDGVEFTTTTGFGCDICWSTPPGILSSADGGAHWSRLAPDPGNRPTYVPWVASLPGTASVVAANGTSVYASENQGSSWTLLADVSPVQCAQVLGATVFTVSHTQGIVFALEYDEVHSVVGTSHHTGGVPFYDPRAAVTTDDRLLVAAAEGVYIADGLSLMAQGTFVWRPFIVGPTPQGLVALEAGPSQRVAGSKPYVDTYPFGSTYLSENGGVFWTQIASVGGGPLAFSGDGQTLYVAQESAMYRLRAAGSWSPEPMPAFGVQVYYVHDLLVDPSGAVYALAVGNFSETLVLRLKPGATFWENLGGAPDLYSFTLAGDGYLYAGGAEGVWRSASALGQVTDAGMWPVESAQVTAFPNPFGRRTHIGFALARSGPVHLAVYDVRGRLVSTLLRGSELEVGPHAIGWEPPAETPNGVYVYRLHTALGERTGRLLLVR